MEDKKPTFTSYLDLENGVVRRGFYYQNPGGPFISLPGIDGAHLSTIPNAIPKPKAQKKTASKKRSKKRMVIIYLLLLLSSIGHFITAQDIKDKNGRTKARISNGVIYDKYGRPIGRVTENSVTDKSGRTLLRIQDNVITDKEGRPKARINSSTITDKSGRPIATIDSTEIRINNRTKYRKQ